MSRNDIFERVFDEMIDNDLVDLQNCDYENAKKAVMEVLKNRFKDFLIIQGEVLQ